MICGIDSPISACERRLGSRPSASLRTGSPLRPGVVRVYSTHCVPMDDLSIARARTTSLRSTPGAALTCWDFKRTGYKTSGNAASKQRQRQTRMQLITTLSERVSWLDLTSAQQACIESDDALDALIASLVGRAAGLGHTVTPPRGDKTQDLRISREGWIHLPERAALEQLVR
jgi:hypothetical protein